MTDHQGKKIDLEYMEKASKFVMEQAGTPAEQLNFNLVYADIVSQMVKESDYKALESPLVIEALEHIRKDFWAYIEPFNERIEQLKTLKQTYNNQLAAIHEENKNRRTERYTIEQELYKCGFFDRAKKKQEEVRQEKDIRDDSMQLNIKPINFSF